jgi:hypothetical protein
MAQRAASRSRRAQRSTAANQSPELAAVRARSQRRKQYFCRRATYSGCCRGRGFGLWLVVILRSSALGGWKRRTGPWLRSHIACCNRERRRKAGAGSSLECPQLPCPCFKFRACWLTVMAVHDGPWLKPMPGNAPPGSLGLPTFAVVSRRRTRLRDGEHGGQAAEGQRGNDSSRRSAHCLTP